MTPPVHDRRYYRRQRQKRLIFITVAILLIVGLAVIWILNLTGVIKGSWSTIFVVIFTVLGALLALFQVHLQAASGTPIQSEALQIHDITLGVNKHKGALIVYAKRDLRGTTINLCRGFFNNGHLRTDAASNVIARKKGGQVVFVSVFPSLEPGRYTVYVDSEEHISRINVHSEQVTEVDWQ